MSISRTEFIRSKLSNISARVSGVTNDRHGSRCINLKPDTTCPSDVSRCPCDVPIDLPPTSPSTYPRRPHRLTPDVPIDLPPTSPSTYPRRPHRLTPRRPHRLTPDVPIVLPPDVPIDLPPTSPSSYPRRPRVASRVNPPLAVTMSVAESDGWPRCRLQSAQSAGSCPASSPVAALGPRSRPRIDDVLVTDRQAISEGITQVALSKLYWVDVFVVEVKALNEGLPLSGLH